ncbi:MAG: T9SS type A sorting domain-containing protein, partial [bacterium]|nr:T9SS type A sorting domain-containing protein [bacterium]
YVAVWPQGQPGKSGPELESPDIRVPPQGAALGKRYPLVDSLVHDGVTWYQFRMDTVYIGGGGIVNEAKTRCFDLNDNVFEPCDTICYIFCATDNAGNSNYFSRRLNGAGLSFTTDDLWEALSSPLEFQILPGGGWKAGGDILYVDDADDRAGPPQLFFDTAFDVLGLLGKVDRYDVNGPSSNVGNSLGSRLVNAANQLDCYQKIFWCTANLSRGLVCDGGVPNGGSSSDKSDDWTPLFNFVDQGTNNKGIYFSGDDLAQNWITLIGASAIQFRTTYMDFALAGSSQGDHVASGEPISPCLVAVGPNFTHLGVPDSLIAYGGCPAINDFDLLNPLQGQAEFINPSSGRSYMISQTTENAIGDTARVILSGFSYTYIRDKDVGFPTARVEHLADIINFLRNEFPNPTAVPDEPVVGRNVLKANYPNPFNPTTTIRYNMRERGHVTLSVYNVAGQLVRTLVDDVREPMQDGLHTVVWHGDSEAGQEVASGVYFYKLVTPGFTKTRKMVLLK